MFVVGGQVYDLALTTENIRHCVVRRAEWRSILGDWLHAVWHGSVVLAYDALAMAGVHVGHLDTTGAVAAAAADATHEQLTALLGLEQTLTAGGVELGWDVAGHVTL